MLCSEARVDSGIPRTEVRGPVVTVVVVLVAQGKTTKQIATQLGLSMHTIYEYRERVTKKTSASNIAGFTQLAFRCGWIK